ncbi:hypothetical protein ACU6U9_05875 [Pseudomonas sp. HK3]
MYKIFILLMCVTSFALSNEGLDTFEKLKKYLFFSFSHIPKIERIEEVNSLGGAIDEALIDAPDDVKNNMLKGLQLYATIYANDTLDKNTIHELKLESQKFLKIALEGNKLDRSLSVMELEVIRAYAGLELISIVVDEIVNSQKNYDVKDIVELKRSKIVALIKLGRFEDAGNEVKALRNDYPDRFKESSVDYYKEEIVEAKKKIQSKKEEITPITETIKEKKSVLSEAGKVDTSTKPVLGKPKQENKQELATTSAVTQLKSIVERYGLYLLALFAVLALYFYSLYKRKKK